MIPKQRALTEGPLYTDQYQLTMAQLYFRMGLHETPAQFEHFFRSHPDYGAHQAGYCVNAGLEWLLDWMDGARFDATQRAPLAAQRGQTGQRLFQDDFLDWLDGFQSLSLHAIPEGRVVHPNVPLTVVQGPLAVAQLLETALLNRLNYATLVATKAARVHQAAAGRPVLEFGMRRGQDLGVNAGGRAALIGGADFSSNAGLSHALGLPPKGTHAHSMVQAFMALGEGELGAFRAYAQVYPDDCLLLLDTINTLESGLPNAIAVFEELRRKGHRPLGVRLDSGDLAYLSVQTAKALDAAGFPETSIVLSNQLDELTIQQIQTQIVEEAAREGMDAGRVLGRLIYGVGTRLITSHGHAALDGVYKLTALRRDGAWAPAIKVSESPAKTPNPGHKGVWRLYDARGNATADLIGLAHERPQDEARVVLRHPLEPATRRTLQQEALSEIEPLLAPALDEGKRVRPPPSLEQMRALRRADVDRLDAGVKRLIRPHVYHVSLTQGLWELKQALIRQAQQGRDG